MEEEGNHCPHCCHCDRNCYGSVLTPYLIPWHAGRQLAGNKPVCGQTYASATASEKAGVVVLHCGACGACSNQQDADIYVVTAGNLTASVRACALLGPGPQQGECLLDIGFTPGCADCYRANIQCDVENCLVPCLAALSAPSTPTGEEVLEREGSLESNPCLACDEAKCGLVFIVCAGANRRRLGILSDIAREEGELCKNGLFYEGVD